MAKSIAMEVATKVNLYYGDGDNLCVITQIYHCHHSVPWDELAEIIAPCAVAMLPFGLSLMRAL